MLYEFSVCWFIAGKLPLSAYIAKKDLNYVNKLLGCLFTVVYIYVWIFHKEVLILNMIDMMVSFKSLNYSLNKS